MQGVIQRLAAVRADAIQEQYSSIWEHINKKPKDIEELAALKTYIEKIPDMTAELEAKITEVKEFYEALDDSNSVLEQDDFNRRMEATGWPGKLGRGIVKAHEMCDREETNFSDNLRGFQGRFKDELNEMEGDITTFAAISDFDRVKEQAATAITLDRKLKEMDATAKKINSRQFLFGETPTNYDEIAKFQKTFQPFSDLWKSASEWIENKETWYEGPLETLDFEPMKVSFDAYRKTMAKGARVFEKSAPGCAKIAVEMKNEMDEFARITTNLDLVEALRNPGMKDRRPGLAFRLQD